MSPAKRLIAASSVLALGGVGFIEALLDRLGYAQTAAVFLPAAWEAALMSEPVLLWGSGLLFLIGIMLLWSVARDTAKMAAEYKRANARSWSFEPDYVAFKEAYETAFKRLEERQTYVETALKQNSELLQQLMDKMDNERKHVVADVTAEAKKIAEPIFIERAEAAQQFVKTHLAGMSRSTIAVLLQQQIDGIRQEIDGRITAVTQQLTAQIEEAISDLKSGKGKA